MAQLERKQAQGACIKFLHSIGWARKVTDALRCKKCFSLVVEHTDKGASDYIAAYNGYALAVEVKADAERFTFSGIRAEQWAWLAEWQKTSKATAWFWIQLGTERVNSKEGLYKKTTYLVPHDSFLEVKRLMVSRRINNLPMNALAAETRVATRDNQLTAEHLLSEYRCIWQQGMFIPFSDHPFWRIYGK